MVFGTVKWKIDLFRGIFSLKNEDIRNMLCKIKKKHVVGGKKCKN